MPEHSLPLMIGITVYGIDSLSVLSGATVTLTLGDNSISGTTNSSGQVILNAANLASGYTKGDIATLSATKTQQGTVSQSVVLDQSKQITLTIIAQTSDLYYYDDINSHVLNFSLITDYEGEKITYSNPFPIVTRGLINNTEFRTARLDASTHVITIMEYGHHEVHNGSAYWSSNSATLGNGEINTVLLRTPNSDKYSHLLLQIDSSAVATFEVLESVTSTTGGTSFTPLNFNRNSSNVSVNTAKIGDTPGANPIVPTGGTAIWTETLGVKGIVTSRTNASELVLKKNTIYLFKITNGATSNNCTILLIWYEHTDKD